MAKTKQERLDARREREYYRKHKSHIKLTGKDVSFYIVDYLVFGLFALISWVPYSLYEKEHWPSSEFGVIYTLFLGLMAILIYDKAAIPRWAKNVLILLLCGLSFFGDWSVIDVILPLILFRFRDEPQKKWNLFLLILLITALTDAAMGAMKHGLSGALGNVFKFGLLFVPLLLKYAQNLSEKEGAQALGIPVTTFKNRLHRARKALRKTLDGEVTFE